jgi:hypothetical protein
MPVLDVCCFSLVLVVLVSFIVSPVMFHYIPSYANYVPTWCQRVNMTSFDSVCQKGDLSVPCRLNQFTYAVMNGTEVSSFRLNLTIDSLQSPESIYRCAGELICPCSFDRRNITGTLTFGSAVGIMLMSIFAVSAAVITLVCIFYECITIHFHYKRD